MIPQGGSFKKISHIITTSAQGNDAQAGKTAPGFPPQAVGHFMGRAIPPYGQNPLVSLLPGPGGQNFPMSGGFGPPGLQSDGTRLQAFKELGPDSAGFMGPRDRIDDGNRFQIRAFRKGSD